MLFCNSAGALCSVAVCCHDREGEEIISSPEEQASCLTNGNSLEVLFYTIITYFVSPVTFTGVLKLLSTRPGKQMFLLYSRK